MDLGLEDALRKYVDRVQEYRDQLHIWNEDEVKRYLIEPLLDALGWDTRNPSVVRHQYPVTMGSETKKADYALMSRNNVICSVEAKGGELDDIAARQGLSYALNLGAPWALATNGRQSRLYGAEFFKSQDVTSALIFDVEITTDSIESSLDYLQYLARGTLDSKEIFDVFKSLNNRQSLLTFLQSGRDTLVNEIIAKWVEESWEKGTVDRMALQSSLEVVFGRVERIVERPTDVEAPVPTSQTTVTAGDWKHLGKGIFALKTDPDKRIDVSRSGPEVEHQLKNLGLRLRTASAFGGFYHNLRREAGLIRRR